MVFPLFSLHLLKFHFMQMALPFGPPPQVLSAQLPQSNCSQSKLWKLRKEVSSTNWWNGPPRGVFLSTPSNVSHFFRLDPYQSRIKPFLYILNISFNFNPYPIFLGVTGCLSSTPIPLLHIEALLPSLRVGLTHQSLSFFERALRLTTTPSFSGKF